MISAIDGVFGLSDCARGEVIGAMGRWELVRVSWEGTWDSGLEVKTGGEGGKVLAGKWGRTVMVTGLKEMNEKDARV
ncbi:hypothetical protein Tco_0220358, partial [Tanacetum coccineum]